MHLEATSLRPNLWSHGSGRRPENIVNIRRLPQELSSKIRTSLSRSFLSPCLTVAPGRNGFQSSPGIVGDRSVHHPADEVHGDPPVRSSRAPASGA